MGSQLCWPLERNFASLNTLWRHNDAGDGWPTVTPSITRPSSLGELIADGEDFIPTGLGNDWRFRNGLTAMGSRLMCQRVSLTLLEPTTGLPAVIEHWRSRTGKGWRCFVSLSAPPNAGKDDCTLSVGCARKLTCNYTLSAFATRAKKVGFN